MRQRQAVSGGNTATASGLHERLAKVTSLRFTKDTLEAGRGQLSQDTGAAFQRGGQARPLARRRVTRWPRRLGAHSSGCAAVRRAVRWRGNGAAFDRRRSPGLRACCARTRRRERARARSRRCAENGGWRHRRRRRPCSGGARVRPSGRTHGRTDGFTSDDGQDGFAHRATRGARQDTARR